MRVPGFGPEARAWQARVLPGYTTPAWLCIDLFDINFCYACRPLQELTYSSDRHCKNQTDSGFQYKKGEVNCYEIPCKYVSCITCYGT